jgi:uncharacterized membrane protein
MVVRPHYRTLPGKRTPSMNPTPQPKSTHRQRGSVVVYTAVTLLAILTSAVVAIEMGRIYGVHRQLQKMASVAALDAVREASRCSRTVAPTQAELEARVNSSLDRNGVLADMRVVTVEPGVIRTERSTRRRFLQPTNLSQATAVRVTLRRSFPPLISGLLPAQTRFMVASATAEQPLSGAFQVGSGLAGLNGGLLNSALGGLIGANLGVVDYTGLANVNVTLQQLATALNVDVHDLSDPLTLQADTPLLRNSLSGLATSLSGTANSTVINLVNGLATAAAGNNGTTALANLLGSYDLTGASAPVINLLDLIFDLAASTRLDPSGTGAVIPLTLQNPTLGIPNVATLAVSLRVLEAPQAGRGRPGDPSAQASTAQVRLMIRTQISVQTQVASALNLVLLGGLLGNVTAPPINLGIDVDVAKATAFLDRIDCPREGVNSGRPIAALSAKPAVATVRLGTYTGAPTAFTPITVGSSQLLGVGIQVLGGLVASINVNLFLANSVSTTAGSNTEVPLPNTVIHFDQDPAASAAGPEVWIADGVPPDAPIAGRNPQTVGSNNVLAGTVSGLFGSLNITASDPAHPTGSSICLLRIIVCTLTIPLDSILNAVLGPVRIVLGAALSGVGGLVDALLDPLLDALGIRVGSATVIMQSVTTAQPVIISTCRPDLAASNAKGCPTEI